MEVTFHVMDQVLGIYWLIKVEMITFSSLFVYVFQFGCFPPPSQSPVICQFS